MIKAEKPKCFLAEVCNEKKITVYDLAKSMGYHPNKFYAYTSGIYTPNVGLALRIAQKLDCKVEDIFKINNKQNG